MLVEPTRASFLAGVISAVFVVPACSSSSNQAAKSSSAQTSCPASFAAVASARCGLEGQVCTYLVPCPTFASNASCVCTGGSFVCAGFDDASTSCPVLSTTQSCPTTEQSASGLFCSDLGLLCTYPSVCSGIPNFDTCQCIGARSASEQNHFECSSSCDVSGDATAPPLEGGLGDATSPDDASDDVRSDGSADSPPPPDGAGDR